LGWYGPAPSLTDWAVVSVLLSIFPSLRLRWVIIGKDFLLRHTLQRRGPIPSSLWAIITHRESRIAAGPNLAQGGKSRALAPSPPKPSHPAYDLSSMPGDIIRPIHFPLNCGDSMSLMLTDILSWKSIVAIGVVIGVVAAILDIGGWLRKFIRLLRRVRKTTQVTVSLHIDDVELRQQECDLLREYLELVQTQAQNVLGSFPSPRRLSAENLSRT
jgi:hypothetical protein